MAKAKKDTTSKFSTELKDALAALNETYSDSRIGGINDAVGLNIEYVSSGSLALDAVLGGGYAAGKLVELYGSESLGKSTLAMAFLAGFAGKPTLYVDHEQSISPDYMAALGVDLDNLIVTQPSNIEHGLDVVEKLCTKVSAVVFDSIAEAATQRELEGSLTDQDIGVKAKILSKFIRKMKSIKHDAVLLFINQVRENPGGYGVTRVVPGGKAFKFGSHMRIDIYGKEDIKKGETVIGHFLLAKVTKNKLNIPYLKCRIPLLYNGKGISREMEIIDLAIEHGILEKAGSWIKYDGTSIAQGVEACRLMLIDNPELRQELENKIRLLNNSSSNAK